MQNSIIADSGFWIALINKKDKHHGKAARFLSQTQSPLVTTWPVITETCHILLKRMGMAAQTAFIHSLSKGYCNVFELHSFHLQQIQLLMEKYADLPMDLADASLVILAGELGHGKILSTDQRDFHAYRWKNRAPFENLLLR